MQSKNKKKVIVIGGGFAGIQLVRRLDQNLFDVLLIDKINHHQFQPLFYQVAASQIEPSNISFPLRNIFKDYENVQIRLAEVLKIEEEKNLVITTIGEFNYDYLVVAIGCKTNFFGNENIEKNSFTLKTTFDAITVRNHILQTFEKIISASDQEKESLFNIVIVGAFPNPESDVRSQVPVLRYPGTARRPAAGPGHRCARRADLRQHLLRLRGLGAGGGPVQPGTAGPYLFAHLEPHAGPAGTSRCGS